jgi:pyrroline-5-carboxylate reductase
MESSDKAIEELVRAVCSPKGSTIEGVDTLRAENFEDTVKKALRASFMRTKELKKM